MQELPPQRMRGGGRPQPVLTFTFMEIVFCPPNSMNRSDSLGIRYVDGRTGRRLRQDCRREQKSADRSEHGDRRGRTMHGSLLETVFVSDWTESRSWAALLSRTAVGVRVLRADVPILMHCERSWISMILSIFSPLFKDALDRESLRPVNGRGVPANHDPRAG